MTIENQMACKNAVLLATLIAAGCATTPPPTSEPAKPTFGKGGYYQDDGPDENPPPDLETIPDATPQTEPLHRFANRPYEVFGEQYTPNVREEPYKQRGVASWYGRKFHGKKTASGETYNMYGMSAAHRTLPIPSYARVTNVKNNRSVIVRVNDRGPFHPNRIIDLSYTAALKLGLINAGSGQVHVERVFAEEAPPFKDAPPSSPAQSNSPAAAPKTAETTDAAASKAPTLFVQLGAFGALATAENFRDKARQELTWLSEAIQIFPLNGLYRVRLGPYATKTEASAIAAKVRETLNLVPQIATQ